MPRSTAPIRRLVRPALGFLARLAAAILSASFISASCGQTFLGILPGVVNDPSNAGLRQAILKFGTGRVCAEMSKRSMPLRLRPEDPSVGRFFTSQCASQEVPGGIAVQFRGSGYVWTNLTQRLGFDASGAIRYDTDFQMDGSTMYIYFRQRGTDAPTFQAKLVEQPQAALASALPFGQGAQTLGNTVGLQIMRTEIAKGFTVIRASNGSAEFGLGMVEKGEHPNLTPYRVTDGGKVVIANDRSEVHQNQRDFVGPVEVTEGAQLIVHLAIDGAPAIDVLIVPRGAGEAWLQQYTTQVATTPPPFPPILDEPVQAGVVWKRTLSLPAGLYYVVLDNTPTAGRTQPTNVARDDRAALVSYGIALDP